MLEHKKKYVSASVNLLVSSVMNIIPHTGGQRKN